MIDLFARNFDSDNAPAAPVTTIDEEELNLRLAEARKQGFDAGRAVGQQDAKAEFDAQEDARLEAESAEIRAQLDALIAQDTRQCRATETDIVELFLGIGDRLVPELLQNYGVDLAIG
ncbi:MAG: flagellar motor switch protein FliH, partial [Roseobacter sp.]